ncbi:MAG: ABC transporter permease [Bdellovibrionales bacterium]|nr:ABC transporter permease [Bdellovibrionales bacterium]
MLLKRFKLSLEIATRFLSSKSRGNFLSFITGVSIVGVSIGVLALLIVTSVVNGFENQLTKVIAGTQGDILFYTRGTPIRDRMEMERKIREFTPGIKAITGSFVSEVMFNGPNGVAGGALEGVDLQSWGEVVRVDEHLIDGGKLPEGEHDIILGSSLAERLGVGVGDSVRVVLPFTDVDNNGNYGAPRIQDFDVSGIVHLGMYEYDSKFAYAPLSSVQQLAFGTENATDKKDWLTSFRIKLEDGSKSVEAAAELSQHFGFPYKVRDWASLNKNLFYAIKVEKAVITVLLTVIMIVAAFNVISALLMMVYEKEREIAILRVVGVRRRDLFLLFSWIGSFFGLAGTSAGIVLGFFATMILRKTKFIHLPAEVYHLEFLPVVIRWTEWSAIALMAFVICFLSTVGPALRISRRAPVEGLKWTS